MFVRLVIVLFFLISCDSEKKTFFSGKILNKTSNYISLFKDNIIISESVVDTAGAFMIELDNIEEGLYTFYHEPEFQYLIIDRYDNLRIRLNTLDFDESLVYTGEGSSKNNFLMDVFLKNELDEDKINSNLDLDIKNFKKLVDSLYNEQQNSFSNFIETNKLSISSKEIIKTAILYPYISKFHSYIIRNNTEENDQIILFDEYNDKYSFDLNTLAYFKPYIDFIYLHVYNKVKNINEYSNSLDFNIKRLIFTNDLIDSDLIKSRVLRFHAVGFLLQREEDSINKKFLSSFYTISKNKSVNEEIRNLYEDLKR